MIDKGMLSETGFYIFFRRDEDKLIVRGPFTFENCIEIIISKYRKTIGKNRNIKDIVLYYNRIYANVEKMNNNGYRIASYLTYEFDTNFRAEIIYYEDPLKPVGPLEHVEPLSLEDFY